jgi:hypothetical protein
MNVPEHCTGTAWQARHQCGKMHGDLRVVLLRPSFNGKITAESQETPQNENHLWRN